MMSLSYLKICIHHWFCSNIFYFNQSQVFISFFKNNNLCLTITDVEGFSQQPHDHVDSRGPHASDHVDSRGPHVSE